MIKYKQDWSRNFNSSFNPLNTTDVTGYKSAGWSFRCTVSNHRMHVLPFDLMVEFQYNASSTVLRDCCCKSSQNISLQSVVLHFLPLSKDIWANERMILKSFHFRFKYTEKTPYLPNFPSFLLSKTCMNPPPISSDTQVKNHRAVFPRALHSRFAFDALTPGIVEAGFVEGLVVATRDC